MKQAKKIRVILYLCGVLLLTPVPVAHAFIVFPNYPAPIPGIDIPLNPLLIDTPWQSDNGFVYEIRYLAANLFTKHDIQMIGKMKDWISKAKDIIKGLDDQLGNDAIMLLSKAGELAGGIEAVAGGLRELEWSAAGTLWPDLRPAWETSLRRPDDFYTDEIPFANRIEAERNRLQLLERTYQAARQANRPAAGSFGDLVSDIISTGGIQDTAEVKKLLQLQQLQAAHEQSERERLNALAELAELTVRSRRRVQTVRDMETQQNLVVVDPYHPEDSYQQFPRPEPQGMIKYGEW